MKEDTQWLDEILTSLKQYNLGQDPITDEDFIAEETYAIYPELKEAKQAILSRIQEIHKAYGNCQNCYGKGYATVNDRWAGYDTDTDIGSAGGYLSGGKPNAMKFCTCERGKQLESHIREVEARAQFRILDRIDAEAADKPRSYLSEIVHREMARLKALQPTNSKEE